MLLGTLKATRSILAMLFIYALIGILSLVAALAFTGATRLAIQRRHQSWVTTAWAAVVSVGWLSVAVRGIIQTLTT